MNSEERTALLIDFMRDLAPHVTKYILAYSSPQEVHFAPEKIVDLTAQIASGLVTRFVELSDAAPPQTTSTKISFAPGFTSPSKPTKTVQRSAPGVSS